MKEIIVKEKEVNLLNTVSPTWTVESLVRIFFKGRWLVCLHRSV